MEKYILNRINILLLLAFLLPVKSSLAIVGDFGKTTLFPVIKSSNTFGTSITITPTPTPTPTKTVYVSPNHQWELSYANNVYPITITSLIDNAAFQDLETPYPIRYVDRADWFPDSSGFILWTRDYEGKIGPSTRLIIYQIHKKGNFERCVSTKLSSEQGFYMGKIYWSPDGLEFAIAQSHISVLVYNQNGVITHNYPIQYKDNNAYFRLFGWTQRGIIYMNGEDASRRPKTISIFAVDPRRPNSVSTLFYTFENNLDIITFDPSSTYLLAHRYSELGNTKKYELAIFNINTKQFEKVIPTDIASIYDFRTTSDSSVLAIQKEDSGEGNQDNLYLFYWISQTLVDQHMAIVNLYKGWNETLNAFEVDQWNSSIRSWAATLVRP